MCIFTVKSVIKYYTEQNTAVYTYLLDARKAFDRVNHWTLFAKLIDSQAPLLIVRVLLFWYQMQNVCIKWGNSYSHYFTICNGVRQGGILSPRLFDLYVNQLTDRSLFCNAGCYYINDMCINHVVYADDICLLAPRAGAPNRGGGSQPPPPLNFGWGVEHLSTPPDFEKIFIKGGVGSP